MKFEVQIKRTINCHIERAFKCPMLCDVKLVHTGYGIMPRITGVSHDESWGKIGGSKRIYANKSWIQKGGFVSMDHVLERIENKTWKIRVDQFQTWMLGFYQFDGTWVTHKLDNELIEITYTFELYANGFMLYPLQWTFANVFWKNYMKKVYQNVEALILSETPYIYE